METAVTGGALNTADATQAKEHPAAAGNRQRRPALPCRVQRDSGPANTSALAQRHRFWISGLQNRTGINLCLKAPSVTSGQSSRRELIQKQKRLRHFLCPRREYWPRRTDSDRTRAGQGMTGSTEQKPGCHSAYVGRREESVPQQKMSHTNARRDPKARI